MEKPVKVARSVKVKTAQSTEEILAERQTQYGDFLTHARITQAFKNILVCTPKWAALMPDQKEALEMVVHKMGRILNGDPNFVDSWQDIAGYVTLVVKRLESE